LLAPGLIDTPMAARVVNDDRLKAYVASKQPMIGGPGSADDVAEAALYLCEPASRHVTGAELVVDGGWCVSEGLREGEAPSEPTHSS
jgi:NAD(P)-dependent dehydrogenase (short-subunit alcohol dehydrogenase family)